MRPELLGDGGARVYGLHGLRLRSPVPLAGFHHAGGGHDVDVRWAPWKPIGAEVPPGRLVAAAPGRDPLSGFLYVATEDRGRWILRVTGVCDFVIAGALDVVECHVDPGADLRLVAVLVAGLLTAFLLALAGHCVLHASAVEIEGVAVAFAGPSGAGKSTLAALLCAAGAGLVTDDVLRLGLGPPVTCVGGCPQLRLRPGATWALAGFARPPATARTVDGRTAVTPVHSEMAAAPVSVIVLPRLSREAPAVELRPARGAASVTGLAAACRVTGWRDAGLLRGQFRALARVAAGVRVIEAVIPRGQGPGAAMVAELHALAQPVA